MIKELAEIDIRPGEEPAFEQAAIQARDLFLGTMVVATWVTFEFSRRRLGIGGRQQQDHGVPGLVNCYGIESPGLTSSLAIARHVRSLLE